MTSFADDVIRFFAAYGKFKWFFSPYTILEVLSITGVSVIVV